MASPTAVYATEGEYRERVSSAADDDTLNGELLAAASRLIDRRLGWAPGSFGPDSEVTVTVWPSAPGRVLRLRDSDGFTVPVQSWSEARLHYGGGGRTVTIPGDVSWVRLMPGTVGLPGRSLRIVGGASQSDVSVWPSDPGWVEVDAVTGWGDTPGPVRELCVHVAREMADSHAGGAAAVVSMLDAPMQSTGRCAMLWRHCEQVYSSGRLARLGVVGSAGASEWR